MMQYYSDRPLIVQNDFTLLLETNHADFEQIRNRLSQFADLIKTPEHLHTYKMTSLSLWNAAASGWSADRVLDTLMQYAKFEVPVSLEAKVKSLMNRFGLLHMVEHPSGQLILLSNDNSIVNELCGETAFQPFISERVDSKSVMILPEHRGLVKQECIRLGYPIQDLVGYHEGERLPIQFKTKSDQGDRAFQLRDYQERAVESFFQKGSVYGGSGVLVLPCGAGKTVIGIGALARMECAALILTTNVTSVRQWKREILEKTNLTEDMVGEYSGSKKEVKPITIATYQILTYRKNKHEDFTHIKLFSERDWGLIIYDEVHLLPAPVFRATADIQATRRLGLTATLVREDGRENDVFSLVGPKRFDMPWKVLEQQGWIANVDCTEVRVPLDPSSKERYFQAAAKEKHRIAGENANKTIVVDALLERHQGEQILIIGQYIDQLKSLALKLQIPLISGEMPHDERDVIYEQFKKRQISVLLVSKVANFAVDLPDATVAIQISGSFGSRQEEAQRLGRILRPKSGVNKAHFYSLVSSHTKEQDFTMNRQLFLVEQGYRYHLKGAELFCSMELISS
jgi:DNA excision repair protein ERCC-3